MPQPIRIYFAFVYNVTSERDVAQTDVDVARRLISGGVYIGVCEWIL